MRTLKFNVGQQTIKKSGDFSNIVSGSSGYLKCQFSFDSEWNGFLKVAEFRKYLDSDVFPVPVINNACTVPDGVLDGSQWYVNVIGKSGNKQITTNKVLIRQEV